MKNLKGPVLLFVVLGVVAVIAYFGKGLLFDKLQNDTSDTSGNVETLNWGGDGYLGYAFLQTVEFKKQFARQGYSLKFTDDEGDYKTRLQKFADKEYDFITLPINSYIEHGLEHDFPGVIVAAIAESKGADAIVGFDDVLPNDKVNDLNNDNLKIYYTGMSPSSFLLDLTISDFDLDQLKSSNAWRNEVNGSTEVYKIAKKATKDRSIGDAFVMWEPEVSKAINELGLKKLWASDKFSGYIIDVFVFHRNVISKNPDAIEKFLKTYFRTLNYYNARQDEMSKQLSKISSIKQKTVNEMIKNIDWFNLEQNCAEMFNIQTALNIPAKDGIINSIYSCSDVMHRIGTIDEDVEDPYLIVNSSFLEKLNDSNLKSVGGQQQQISFAALSAAEWKNLHEIGTMRVDPITFQSGTSQLDYQGELTVDDVAKLLANNYPNYRVIVKGHTGSGDESANLKLSQQRADIVRQRLIAVHAIDPNRILASGLGATQPPKQKNNENPRAYRLRWARVEFVLLNNDQL